MKFSCDRCKTRYSISDEKVRGKVLKIRCKTCDNIVVVREQLQVVVGEQSTMAARDPAILQAGPARGATAGGPSAPSAPASSSGAIAWYVAIKGQQHGPATHDDVIRLFRDARITERTYLWHDGLAAWTRLRDLPEFASVLLGPGASAAAPAASKAAASAASAASASASTTSAASPEGSAGSAARAGGDVVSLDAARAQRQAQGPARSASSLAAPPVVTRAPSSSFAAQPGKDPRSGRASKADAVDDLATTNDPFAAVADAPTIGGTSSRSGAHAEPPASQSTRVFIMQAGLHNRSTKHRAYAGIAAAAAVALVALGVVDYHYDILGLKKVVDAVAVSTGIIEEPVVPEVAWSTDDVDPKLLCKLRPDFDNCVKQEVEARKKRPAKKALPRPVGVSESELDGAFRTGGVEAGGTIGATGAGGVAQAGFADVSNAADAARIGQILASGKGGPAAPKATIDTPPLGGTNLDAANIASVIKAGQPAIQICVERGAKDGNVPEGKQMLTLSITPRGIVEQARFKNSATNASPVGECVTSAARKWKFAPFVGETTDVEFTLVLSVGM